MRRVTVGGRQLLHYTAPAIDVAVLRGTTSDTAGNISFEREAVFGDCLNQACCPALPDILTLAVSGCQCGSHGRLASVKTNPVLILCRAASRGP